MDRRMRQISWQRRAVVADMAGNIEQTTENGIADRNGDRASGGTHRYSALESCGRLKSDTTDRAGVEMRLNLNDEGLGLIPLDDQGLVDERQSAACEGDIDHRSAHGQNLSAKLCRLRHHNDHTQGMPQSAK